LSNEDYENIRSALRFFATETPMLLFIGQGDSLIGVSMDNCEKEGCLPSVL
jgi:hypothetical protein